ncbi:small acid-soluble spore protein Tlp [Marinicrinis sediminis]|uniref:Small acid-soluble spore protein Tlp n=1 Tax=Marinicrinis sediminis TaxID=1652465 RepID=A0ABW5REK9_9BACL
MAKPDNRSDNVERLQEIVQNTQAKLETSKDYIQAHGSQMNEEDLQQMKAKNERRAYSLEGLREEIKDEASYQGMR